MFHVKELVCKHPEKKHKGIKITGWDEVKIITKHTKDITGDVRDLLFFS